MARALQLGALRLERVTGHGAHRGGARLGRAAAAPWLVAFQVRGRSSWHQGSWRAHLRAGDFLICPTGAAYALSFGGEYEMPVLWVDADTMARITPAPERFARRPLRHEDADCGLVTAFVAALVRCAERLPDPMRARGEDQVIGMLAGALAERGPTIADTPAGQRAVVEAYVRERIRDPELSVAQLAQRFGCTTRHLHTLFADAPMTLGRSIRRTRVLECLRAVDAGTEAVATLTALAARWGFYDASHLRRCFRAELALSAQDLRCRLAAGLERGCGTGNPRRRLAP